MARDYDRLGDVARAIATTGGIPLLLHVRLGTCLEITSKRSTPVGSNAFVEFTGVERPVPGRTPG